MAGTAVGAHGTCSTTTLTQLRQTNLFLPLGTPGYYDYEPAALLNAGPETPNVCQVRMPQ
jgi:hypothetical protein